MTKTMERFVTRGGATDAVMFMLPTLPSRVILIRARQRALGWREETNEEGEDILVRSGEPDAVDATAVVMATLGLCWEQPTLKQEHSLRGCGRDAIEYGEHAQTALWDAGYRDMQQLSEIARDLHTWMEAETFGNLEEIAQEQEGFGGAQSAS